MLLVTTPYSSGDPRPLAAGKDTQISVSHWDELRPQSAVSLVSSTPGHMGVAGVKTGQQPGTGLPACAPGHGRPAVLAVANG